MATQSPNLSLLLFIGLTIIYFIFQYKTEEKYGSALYSIYIISVVSLQLWSNMLVTKGLCGSIQSKPAIVYTIVPWLIIFGLINLGLILFPSWLMPFSNTFGYAIIKWLGGLDDVMSKVIKSKDQVPGNKNLSETLGDLYNNPSLLINQIPNATIGFDNFWNELSKGGLLTSEAGQYRDKFLQLIRLKNIISKFIWFTLTGLLTVSTSYNYLVKSSCNSNVKDMERRHAEYQQLVKDNSENEQEPRVYVDYGH
tara:strand:- start:608 stop:1366 length:759 start_codon:yes stop_codon:yes gene_type:complete